MERYHTSPFTLLVDDREQLPLDFDNLYTDKKDGEKPILVKQRTVHLPTGDYSIDGMQDKICIERKSPADLFSTLGKGRDRFVREIERMAEFQFAAIVVEAEWSELLEGLPRSEMNPKTIWRTVLSWQLRYPYLHWNFLPGRRLCSIYTYRMLDKFWRKSERQSG